MVGLVTAGQEVGLADHAQDVRRMTTAGALGVEGAQGAAARGSDGVLDEAALVERVAVDGHLGVRRLGDRQAGVDRARRRAPVLVQLQSDGPGLDLLHQGLGPARIALAQEAQVHGQRVGGLEHAAQVGGARRAGGGKGAGGRTGAPTQHGGDAGGQCLVDLLRADEVDVAVDAACGDDQALGGNDLGAGADDDVDARHDIGVAGLADGRDAAAAQADVGLDDAPVVDDERIGDHAVHGVAGAGAVRPLALAHAIAYGLAAAELDLFAMAAGTQREVLFDLDQQRGVGQADAVTGGRAVHLGVGTAFDAGHHSAPCTWARKPNTRRAPA
jgi:hypothetical protein